MPDNLVKCETAAWYNIAPHERVDFYTAQARRHFNVDAPTREQRQFIKEEMYKQLYRGEPVTLKAGEFITGDHPTTDAVWLDECQEIGRALRSTRIKQPPKVGGRVKFSDAQREARKSKNKMSKQSRKRNRR